VNQEQVPAAGSVTDESTTLVYDVHTNFLTSFSYHFAVWKLSGSLVSTALTEAA
jgi:hypothetical protein